jgi:hypothetical protein
MAITSDHIYNRIAVALSAIYGGNYTFEEIQDACELAKKDGTNIQTYGVPARIARMLKLMEYVK